MGLRLLPALLGATLGALMAQPAAAHLLGAHGVGLAAGLAHPLSGLDHVLAMVAVGLWAAQLGGRALWAVPLAFVLTMAAGGAAGALGFPLPMVELGIAGSLIVLGLLVAFGSRLPVAAAAALVGLLAFFHGHAHGTELPETANALVYAAGFLAATAFLHGVGIVLGRLARPGAAAQILRMGGAGIAAAGIVLILG